MSPQKEKEIDIDRHRSEADAWEREQIEREKERERDAKEARDKRQSKDITPLDHRGSSGVINIVEHSTNSQDRRTSSLNQQQQHQQQQQQQRRELRNSKDGSSVHNGNNGNITSGNNSSITNITSSSSPQRNATATAHRMANGSGMNSVIFPLLTDVSRICILYCSIKLSYVCLIIIFVYISCADSKKVSICW